MGELNDAVEVATKVIGETSSVDEYKAALASAGIDPVAMPEAPDPGPTVEPVGLESLVDQTSTHEGVRKQSAPMRLLGWYTQDGGGKYQGYKSFAIIDVWHPDKGRILVTHSYERTDGSVTPVGMWLRDRMKKGDVFQVGEVGTNRGFTVYRPITVG
jgi:hypothetical protein